MTTLIETVTPTRTTFVQKYPLVTFFLLAFGLTWSFMIVDALGSRGILPFRLPVPLLIVMGYMPTLAAVMVAGLSKGRQGVRVLFGKLLIVRVGIGWYAFAIFGFGAMSLLAIMLSNLINGEDPSPILSQDMTHFPGPLAMILNIAMLYLVLGLVNGEELAWRGFALPRLQKKYNSLLSSIILGAIWGLFHLPLFFTTTGTSQADESFIPFLFSTIVLSVLFTALFNNTRGSVFLAYLFHASTNTWTRVIAIDHAVDPHIGQILTGIVTLVAIILVLTLGAENLSRKTIRIQEE